VKHESEFFLAIAVVGLCLVSTPACAKPAAQRRTNTGVREEQQVLPGDPHRGRCTQGSCVEEMRLKIVRTLPHDPKAFTQGLLFYDGKFYESTGLRGRSSVRRVDPESGVVERKVDLPAELFGEGLARVGGRLIQLTWQEGRAVVWNLATMSKEKEFTYEGEGWGLCFDGYHLIMSDGSERLVLRDPETFAKRSEVVVRRAGKPLRKLNELECVDGVIYANVWQDNHIARIDPQTGDVTAWIDAAGLLPSDPDLRVDVLNGIAYLPTTGHLMITGKLWPKIFEVEMVPAASANE
jgi:glutaminyl-peptide cyclotransferase